jgi:hypothetical protein
VKLAEVCLIGRYQCDHSRHWDCNSDVILAQPEGKLLPCLSYAFTRRGNSDRIVAATCASYQRDSSRFPLSQGFIIIKSTLVVANRFGQSPSSLSPDRTQIRMARRLTERSRYAAERHMPKAHAICGGTGQWRSRPRRSSVKVGQKWLTGKSFVQAAMRTSTAMKSDNRA